MAPLTEAKDLRSQKDANQHDNLISIKVTECESNFLKSLRLMESKGEQKHADCLRELQARFVSWTAYLGVFDVRNGSLDQRLKRYPRDQYHDHVLYRLACLNRNLIWSMAEPNDDTDRRVLELGGIQMWIDELDELAIDIRQAAVSSLDILVAIFAETKLKDILRFEKKAILVVSGLYPEASESLRRRIIKSMVKRYARLLYWKFHDKKLRADRRRDGQPHDDRGQTQPKPTPSPFVEPAQRQRSMKDDASNFPSPPQFEDEEERKPCPLCRKIFSKADFGDVRWWTHHVNEDLSPFTCVSCDCWERPTFASRSDWIAYMESNHGVFWSRSPSTPHRNKQKDPDLRETSSLGQYVDICPLCCLPVDEPKDAYTDMHQPTVVPAMQTSNEPREQLPLDSRETNSEIPSTGSKGTRKSVRFLFTEQDSEQSSEGEGLSKTSMEAVNESGTQKIAKTMLNHIADHLQFLALLTPRLSTKKLAIGKMHSFSSSLANSDDNAPGKRSTLDDELESNQGDEVKEAEKHGILPENLLPEAESTHRLEENRLPNEEMGAAMPIDWSLYSIPMQPTTKGDDVIEHMQNVRVQCDRLLEAALDNIPDHELVDHDKAYFTRIIRPGRFSYLSELEKAIRREDLRDFFNMLLSSVDRGDEDILVDYCTEQVWTDRHYQDPERRTELKLASRRRLFAILLARQSPSDILRIIKTRVSDLDILSASNMRQYLPTWTDFLTKAGRSPERCRIEELKVKASRSLPHQSLTKMKDYPVVLNVPIQVEDSQMAKDRQCLIDLESIDPREDEKRTTLYDEDGLLDDSYVWIP